MASPVYGGSGCPQAVVFDLGGVLLDWDPRYLYRKLFSEEAEMERFLAEVCTLEWHAAHDRGVSFATGAAPLIAAHPALAAEITAWGERSEEMVGAPIAGTVEVLRELRAREVPCYALTNMEAETYPQRLERFEFLDWFDGTVVSSAEGVAKPDPEIFLRLLQRFGLNAGNTVMIDDSLRNLETARALGMQTIHFRTPEDLRSWFVGAGMLDPDS